MAPGHVVVGGAAGAALDEVLGDVEGELFERQPGGAAAHPVQGVAAGVDLGLAGLSVREASDRASSPDPLEGVSSATP